MRMNNFDLNLLKVFVSVADTGSFTLAGKLMFIEQSSITKAVQRLENELGAQLFSRTKRSVQLTSTGERLLPIAQQILHDSADFILKARDKKQELSGTLKLGAVSPLSFLFVPSVVKTLSKEYPQLWPMIFTGMVDDLAERVKSRELEFALIAYEGERLKELEYVELGKYAFRIVAASQISKEGLNSFIGSREIHDRQHPKLPTFDKLKKINKNLKIHYSANDFMAYKELILAGLGIGLLPERMCKEEIRTKILKPLHPEMALEFPVYLVRRANPPLSLEAKRFIELFKSLLH